MATQTMQKTLPNPMDPAALHAELAAWNGLGADPLAARFTARRAAWDLFTPNMRAEEIEALRDYLLPSMPEQPSDAPVVIHNLVGGEWRGAAKTADMPALFDKRVTLARIPDSRQEDVEAVLASAFGYWQSLEWAEEVLTYRKWVAANVSRVLDHYTEEIMSQIRHLIPKTRIEAQKDFWEGKRAVDHIAGNADKAMQGEMSPPMMGGHTYWKNPFLPAGVVALITPMNFIYGIPMIQLIGAYIAGAPLIFKGHPYGAIANTTMARIFLAAGADPRAFHKVEGFGKGIGGLATDTRVAVVSVTGAEATAKSIALGRGLRTLKFEGGGCNWAWVDNGYSDDELEQIATRLAYSKLGFSSHKCTTLHGIAAEKPVLEKLVGYLNAEMDTWEVADPRTRQDTKVLGPNMVHQAQTITNIQEGARMAGLPIRREGGRVSGDDYSDNAEVVKPVIIEVQPHSEATADWDGKGAKTFSLATTEFFMPILCVMPLESFDAFLRFCLFTNSHDLACSIWSRDDRRLQRARRVIGGMLKENDGTDSALEWEEFGASGIGDSGNMGVGEAASTIGIFCRRQKGRHVIF